MAETLVQKIISAHLGGKSVEPGEVAMLPCDVVLGGAVDRRTHGGQQHGRRNRRGDGIFPSR